MWEVSATFRGKRVRTEMGFTSKAQAMMYADQTNKNYPGANARVVNGTQNPKPRMKKTCKK